LWLLAIVDLAVMGAAAEALDLRRRGRAFLSRRADEPALNAQMEQLRLRVRQSIIALLVIVFVASPLPDFLAGGPIESDLPVALCDYLDRYNPPGRMFNGFNNAPYLAWRSGEKRPLYIDHLQAHSDDLTRDYIDITEATPRGQKLLDDLRIGYVTVRNPRNVTQWPRLKDHLNSRPDWELVFWDLNAALWVRKTPEYAAMRAERNKYLPVELQ
jgi:hypothetical protein